MSRRSRAGYRPPSLYALFFSGILLSLLAGCGSGGGSGSGGVVSITQQNSTQVAGASYQAVNGTAGSGDTGASTFLLTVSGTDKSSLKVTAEGTGALLEGDTNGDGSVDFSLSKGWSELTP